MRAEVKILKAEKERAEMEASFFKKLEEIERRGGAKPVPKVMNTCSGNQEKNMKIIIIQLLHFVNLVMFL